MQNYKNGITGKAVISTHISPEGACNLKCPYCSVTNRETKYRIELPKIKKYVEDLKSRGLKAVILTGGGEPTIYKHFNELVRWLKLEQELSVALITNGTQTHRVDDDVWKMFSWVRVSINLFFEWEKKIKLPISKVSDDCVVGASFVYTPLHEAPGNFIRDQAKILTKVSELTKGAEYIRLLPNCLLPQEELAKSHEELDKVLKKIGDDRFFHQDKNHATPKATTCHQSFFRPYLSEAPYHKTGEPGTVYPCDSLVLNDEVAYFDEKYQLCGAEDVLDYLDKKIPQPFNIQKDCTGCVFTDNVDMLEDFLAHPLETEFDHRPLKHEEFV